MTWENMDTSKGDLENGRLKTNFVPFACRSYEQIILMLQGRIPPRHPLEDMLRADLAQAEEG